MLAVGMNIRARAVFAVLSGAGKIEAKNPQRRHRHQQRVGPASLLLKQWDEYHGPSAIIRHRSNTGDQPTTDRQTDR